MTVRDGKFLVTGAGSGIGAAIAETLALAGAHVAVNDLDPDTARQSVERIVAAGGNAVAAPGDIARRDAAGAVVSAAAEALGGLSGLVNNVGLARPGTLEDIGDAEWDFSMRVNCSSAVYCAQSALPYFRPGAAIVNLSSVCSYFPAPGAGSYNAAKSAINSLTQQMAVEWGPRGVRANAIAPGLVSGTNFSANSTDVAAAERKGAGIPLGRTASAKDIAPVARFLLSDDARYITGQVLVVDGGLTVGLQQLVPA